MCSWTLSWYTSESHFSNNFKCSRLESHFNFSDRKIEQRRVTAGISHCISFVEVCPLCCYQVSQGCHKEKQREKVKKDITDFRCMFLLLTNMSETVRLYSRKGT